MKECNHDWNCVFSEDDVIEVEYTHLLIRVKCEKCGIWGLLDSDIAWKDVWWDHDMDWVDGWNGELTT